MEVLTSTAEYKAAWEKHSRRCAGYRQCDECDYGKHGQGELPANPWAVLALKDIPYAYWQAGWHPVPLPAGKKKLPLIGGITGGHRAAVKAGRPDQPNLTEDEVLEYDWQGKNLAVRFPQGTFGIDVDDYKEGDAGLTALKKLLGAEVADTLETTFVSSKRELPSGIYPFRMPPEWRNPDGSWPKLKGIPCSGIEIIQYHHRYAVVAPSRADGAKYRWLNPDGQKLTRPPLVQDLPVAPAEWLEPLLKGDPDLETGEAIGGAHDSIIRDVGHLLRQDWPNEDICDHIRKQAYYKDALTRHERRERETSPEDDLQAALVDFADNRPSAEYQPVDEPADWENTETTTGTVREDGKPLSLGQNWDVAHYITLAEQHGEFHLRTNEERTIPYIYDETTGAYVEPLHPLYNWIENLRRKDKRAWSPSAYQKNIKDYICQRAQSLPLERWRTWTSFSNGDYNAATQTFHPDRSPDRNITLHIPRNYLPAQDADEDSLLWQSLKNHIYPDDLLWLTWEIGRHLVGRRTTHLPILVGQTATWKSTFISLLEMMVGENLYTPLDLYRLLKGGDEQDRQLGEVIGKVLATCGDLDEQNIKNLGALKTLTGGETLTGRKIYGRPQKFHRQALIIATANEPPRTNNPDPALQRRMRFVCFDTPIKGSLDDQHLQKYSPADLDHLFSLCVDMSRNDKEPARSPQSTDFTEDYWKAQDLLTETIRNICHHQPGASTLRSIIVKAVREEWEKYKTRQAVPSTRKVAAALRETLPRVTQGAADEYQSKGNWRWRNITLENPDDILL